MNKYKFLGIMCLVTAFIIFGLGYYSVINHGLESEGVVDCYDQKGNKIIGVECEYEPDMVGWVLVHAFVIAFLMSFFFAGAIVYFKKADAFVPRREDKE